MADHARAFIRGDEPLVYPMIPPEAARSFSDVIHLIDLDSLDEPERKRAQAALMDRVIAIEMHRSGTAPSVFAFFKAAIRRARLEDERWVPGWLTRFARKNPPFRRLWRVVRLRCEWCEGYLIVRHRRNGAGSFKFAGCSNYTSGGCRFTTTSKQYTVRKGRVILALLLGEPAPFEHFIVAPPADRAERKEHSPRQRIP